MKALVGFQQRYLRPYPKIMHDEYRLICIDFKLLHSTRGRGAHPGRAGGQVPEQPQQQRQEDGHPHLGGARPGNTRL